MIDGQLDRSRRVEAGFAEVEAQDVACWMSKTPTDRTEGVEYLRRWQYGDDQVDAPVQMFIESAERPDD